MTGDDIFAALGVDPSKPARTLRMVCDALAAAHEGKRVIVVCGNYAETRRISLAALTVAAKVLDESNVTIDVSRIQFVEVSRDPARYLRGFSGAVFMEHFARRRPVAGAWIDMMLERGLCS